MKCWNCRGSVGGCVKCGCCSNDPKERAESRLVVIRKWIGEDKATGSMARLRRELAQETMYINRLKKGGKFGNNNSGCGA